ncbi:MAG TPA: ribbon-helix-helix protein, CopG family [Solirubrobacteraceae bacterium]|nr:ribbon-helix-helix protein, CopG family [Solirubrobacteraceae bacterium]
MRTTLTLAEDVAAAIEQLRRERSIGMSEAVNELVRAGLASQCKAREPFRQKSYDLGVHINVDNIGEALEVLDGPAAP